MRRLFLSVLLLASACTSDNKGGADGEAETGGEGSAGDPGSGDDGMADGGDDATGDDGGDDGTGDDGGEGPEAGVISLETRDGVTLVADYAPVGASGPAIVLLHMIPPHWDRTSYPADFIATLNAEGWTVLNVDRRGSGDSGGTPEDAYDGPNGKWDAEAAVQQLTEDGFGPIGIVGASNGTTTALDYAVWSAGDGASEGATPVSWLVFMTGGTYTESQFRVERADTVPVLFTFSTEERGWSVGQEEHNTGAWSFEEYADGDHGTKMFDTSHAAEITGDIVTFAQGAFGG